LAHRRRPNLAELGKRAGRDRVSTVCLDGTLALFSG
jgi:hypothetical protein